ncbi:M48 family peptidase [bacterium]|nr:MAG: M48 family peptidase [bacterium]
MDIPYSIIYSNRKTINIIVERDRKVVVRAPLNTSEDFIKKEIQKRKRLLLEKVGHHQKYPAETQTKEFVSGESLMYLGKNYKLYVVDEPIEGVSFDSKFFICKTNQSEARVLFREWYKKAAERIIIPKVKILATQLGISYNSITILDLKYRWGSCTPKDNLHFNWRLIKAPMNVIEYIIIHELTHIYETNHTPEFWTRVSVQQPGYEKAKAWLKENGELVERDF